MRTSSTFTLYLVALCAFQVLFILTWGSHSNKVPARQLRDFREMPKAQYKQKFRKQWLNDPLLKSWVQEMEGGTGNIKCKYCNITLTSLKLLDLRRHGETRKHKIAARSSNSQPVISFPKLSVDLRSKLAEVKVAFFIAQHCSIRTCDHLVDLCKVIFPDSDIVKCISLHRTKCSSIIKNVLYDFFKTDLRKDIEDGPFSLLLDESTDLSTIKFLGVTVIYYSATRNTIVSTFLHFAKLLSCNAEGIVAALEDTLNQFKLSIKNLKGIGTDNASVMVGVNNGVYQKLKQKQPNLILIRCICHSIQLAVSAASDEALPRSLNFLLQETYNWFSRSSERQNAYKEIYQTINNDEDPIKIPQMSATRWLSVERAVSTVMDQWEELKLHFGTVRHSEKCYTAEILYNMFCDPHNFLYFTYLRPILKDLQRVNKLFESNDIDSTRLLDELMILIQSLVKKITTNSKFDLFEHCIEDYVDQNCYMGHAFDEKARTIVANSGGNIDTVKVVKQRCIHFVVALIKQLKQRLPENVKVLQKVAQFSVENTLKANKSLISEILIHSGIKPNQISEIEDQYQNINLQKWQKTEKTSDFWIEVLNYKDAGGNHPFQELASFVMSLLVLPNSNAEVERSFSQMNIIKSKLRNKMMPEMLNAIMTVKAALRRYGKCCFNFDEIPPDVLKKIHTRETYLPSKSDDEELALTESLFVDLWN